MRCVQISLRKSYSIRIFLIPKSIFKVAQKVNAIRTYIFNHIPDRNSLTVVFSVFVTIVYSWTLVTSFWKIPSWIYYIRITDILSIYAYSFVVNFIESIILLCATLSISLFFPVKWWKDKFISRSVVFIASMMGSTMYRISEYLDPNLRDNFVSGQWKWFIVSLALAIVLSWLIPSIKWMRKGIESISERFVGFLYLYLPLTFIALVVIIIRILF